MSRVLSGSAPRTRLTFLGMPAMKVVDHDWVEDIVYQNPLPFVRTVVLLVDRVLEFTLSVMRVEDDFDLVGRLSFNVLLWCGWG